MFLLIFEVFNLVKMKRVFILLYLPSVEIPAIMEARFSFDGTLITDRHVLTAAHAFDNITGVSFVEAHISAVYREDEVHGIVMKTSTYIIHPEYNKDTLMNDLAIIEFYQPVDLGFDLFHQIYVLAAMLPSKNFHMEFGVWLNLIGWGQHDNNGTAQDYLENVFAPIVPYDTCENVKGEKRDRNMFCVGGPPYYSACYGDSGGGVFLDSEDQHVENILVGVISHSNPAECNKKPTVAINVTSYIDWIHENTLKATCAPCIVDLKPISLYD